MDVVLLAEFDFKVHFLSVESMLIQLIIKIQMGMFIKEVLNKHKIKYRQFVDKKEMTTTTLALLLPK